MTSTPATDLKLELKRLIVEECDRDIDPASLADDAPLFGPESPLDLDSLDGLQISMALQQRYGVRIADPKELRRVLTSINDLAAYLGQR